MSQVLELAAADGRGPRAPARGAFLATKDAFPGWERVAAYIEAEIVRRGARAIADIGGGANPVVPVPFLAQHGLDYTVIDIAQSELDKAPAAYSKVCVDIAAPAEAFAARLGDKRFDLIFSHMVMEHIADPERAHRNILHALNPGGVAIHLFPTPNSLPLFLNRLLPDGLTRMAVRLLQPERDLEGHQVKFPAYYRMCGAPSKRSEQRFAALGYEVEQHGGYVGHVYYKRLPVVRTVEHALRPLLVRAGIPMTSFALVILRKPQ